MTTGQESSLSPVQALSDYVSCKLAALQKRYINNDPNARRQLAELRRSLGKDPGTTPNTWNIEFEGLPERLVGRDAGPSEGEWAVHIAMSLYALHQQSQTEPMYVSSQAYRLGNAVRVLVQDNDNKANGETLAKGQMPYRFAAMITAQTMQEFSHYARQLVSLLHAKKIPLDYGRFVRQIYLVQFSSQQSNIRLEWAREYAATSKGANN